MEIALKLFGILFGVLARMILPYLRKLKTGKIEKFEGKYWISAMASFILGLITTMLIFPEFNVSAAGAGVEASVKLFCLAFGFGFGWNSIVSEGQKWGEKAKKE